LPFIPAIRRTADGALYGARAGTFFTLFRWLPGTPLQLEGDAIKRAGFALGQIHAALVPLAVRHSYVSDLSLLAFDWTNNTLARGDVLAAASAALPPVLAAERDYLRAARTRLDRWLRQCRREQRFAAGITHGDFYRGNLLVAGGAITAVLDWDEATTSWTAYEVANAVWEFARDDRRAEIDPSRRDRFLGGYVAACPLPPIAPADEVRLIAVRRLIELQHTFFEYYAGRTVDLDYALLNLRFLKRLLAHAG
jgi:Ser/Thr protein kinase RdoA (MazF antagonist)